MKPRPERFVGTAADFEIISREQADQELAQDKLDREARKARREKKTMYQNMTYEAYRMLVIEECVKLTGEHNRDFWETQCSWEEDHAEGYDPEDVAYENATAN